MQALKRRLRLSPSPIPHALISSSKTPPLYQRTPPLWARWAYALVACDIFMTASAVDLTWNHWTQPQEQPSTDPPSPAAATAPAPAHFVPRPTWQRLALSLVHLGIGVGAAVALIGSHARVVRTLCVLPPHPHLGLQLHPPRRAAVDGRRLFVQCAHHSAHSGAIFPLSRCQLHAGRDATELILRVQGERGHWWVGLEGAVVEGREAGAVRARKVVLGAWEGNVKDGAAWKSGPIVG